MLKKLKLLYWYFIASPEQYAKHIGVEIGHNCNIETRNFSSEPYLIKIGSYVAVTKGVFLHTHGGGGELRGVNIHYLMYLGK